MNKINLYTKKKIIATQSNEKKDIEVKKRRIVHKHKFTQFNYHKALVCKKCARCWHFGMSFVVDDVVVGSGGNGADDGGDIWLSY